MPVHRVDAGKDPQAALAEAVKKIERRERIITVLDWANGWLIVTAKTQKKVETR